MVDTSSGAVGGISKQGNTAWLVLVLLILFVAGYLGLRSIGDVSVFETEPEPVRFVDATEVSGLASHLRPPIYNDNPGYLETMGGGIAVGDFDGDGLEDIFFATMPSFDPQKQEGEPGYTSALYRNLGDGTFEDVTVEAGLANIKGFPMGALFFDYNNNGRQDLYVASYDGGQLFKNEGGYFVDVTDEAGVNLDGLCENSPCLAAAASAADYNRNGYLDLLVVNNVEWNINDPRHYGSGSLLPFNYRSQPTVLFRNNGNGTFTNVSEESGVSNIDQRGYLEDGKGLSAVWTDFNNDGWPDIYIANDMTPNRFYLNNRDGTFREIGIAAGVDEIKSSMGVDSADFNYNGNMDLITTNLEGSMVSLFRNYGDIRFDYATTYSGLISSGRGSGWGILFIDLDLDGHLDLVVANGSLWQGMQSETENMNMFFRNNGNGRFEDISENVVRFDNDEISRGLAVIDVNRSGKPDLIFSNIDGKASQLLMNETVNNNNWIRLDLEGVISNRDAVGARVWLTRKDGLTQNQMVKAGNSYQSTSSKSLFFGLGNSETDELRIEWPSGNSDLFRELPSNTIIHIREGENNRIPAEVVSQ